MKAGEYRLGEYAKALVAALTAGVASLGAALTDGHVTGLEWLTVALAVLTALGAVYGVPNTPPPPLDDSGDAAAVDAEIAAEDAA